MASYKNKLPVAVDVVFGGEASPRTSGMVVSMEDKSTGSINLGSARRFRLLANLRSWTNKMVLIGYSASVTPASAEYVLTSLGEIRETVPPNTTIYWALYDTSTFLPIIAGATDYLAVTCYE
ncbi:MAG TPA: hypothetical protein PLZ21_00240 [Armatimonadota bacterium]|nr:hypothetical protein [Armatimonadota bacterium]